MKEKYFSETLAKIANSLSSDDKHALCSENKTAAKKNFENVPWPAGMQNKECSLGKDKNGYFVYTHRNRSKSYATPYKIPKSKIRFIESTG